MDEFGCGFAHDVYAEEFGGFGVENDFQDTAFVAGDGASGDFAESSDADFVGDAFVGEFLFCFAYDGDFGDGVDAEGHELRVGFEGCSQSIAGGPATLFHRGGGECGESDDVACGVYVWDVGLEFFIYGNEAPVGGFNAGGFEVEFVGGGGAS